MAGSLRYRPFAGPSARATVAERPPASEQLPSIDDFIDELPPIESFLAEEVAFVEEPEVPEQVETEAPPPISVDAPSEGWAEGEWQSYDWGALSSLSRTPARPSAAEEWGESEWPEDEQSSSDSVGSETPSADEIADALDGIARRIRSGELVIDNLHGTPPEAAMAAALAVLLRMRG
jgi:hypothetical protein